MLEESYKSFRALADEINWKDYNQNDLFVNYLKYKDTDPELAEKFYAAIICRYWGYSGRLYIQCNHHVTFEQCYDVLIDTIDYVLDKHVWDDPDSSLYQDKTGPDKAFHIVLKRQLGILMASLNANKRRANFNYLSIDELKDKYNDAADGLFNYYSKNSEDEITMVEFIKKHTPLQIIILDLICFSQWNTMNNIVADIRNLDMEMADHYWNIYELPKEELEKIVNTKYTNKQLLSEIKKTLYIAQQELIS